MVTLCSALVEVFHFSSIISLFVALALDVSVKLEEIIDSAELSWCQSQFLTSNAL